MNRRNDFFEEIYSVVALIPKGKVLSYGGVATLAGRPTCARMAGQAMHNAPAELNLPCHRVVSATGRTAPDWEAQRMLLETERVTFRKNDCVDMAKHIWQP